jgi:hypothetical protein
MAQIFISYSKQDIAFARHLRTLLQNAGFEVWLDEKLIPSTQWWRVLEAEIKASRALVVIMSPASAESRWVEREILVAENANLPIFPVLLAGEGWSRLADIQFEDMTAGLSATLPQRFIDALRAVIDGKPIAKTASQPIAAPLTQVTTERRLLEAAMPAETVRGSETELWAKITLPDSPGLRDELPAVVPGGDVIQKSDARTTSFPFRFPIDPRTGARLPARVTLKARSTDFIVESPGGDDSEVVELPPDVDSRTVIFTLTPKPGGRVSGRARVIVDLIYDKQVIAQISCATTLVEEATRAAVAAGWGLWSVPVGATSASAGGYAAPGGVMRGDDESIPPEESPDAFGAEEAEEPAPRARERDSIAPAPPMVMPPAPKPQAVQRVPADLSGAGVPPTASRVPPRRTLNFPMAASAIAALVLVFGLVFVLTSQQNPAINTSQATQGGSAIALAGTASSTPDATVTTIGISATDQQRTQNAVTGATSVIRTTRPTETPFDPSPEPVEASATPGGFFPPTRTSDSSDVGESPSGRSGVAGTLLTNCTTRTETEVLFTIMSAAGITYERLEGEALQQIIAQTMRRDGAALLFHGSCFPGNDVLVTAELFQPPRLTGLVHPRSLTYAADVASGDVSESLLYDFVVGMTYYSFGWMDAEVLERLERVVSAIDSTPSAEYSFVNTMNSGDTEAMLHLLIGNLRWVVYEDYDGALEAYRAVSSDTPAYALAQANIGALFINRIYQSQQGGATLDDPLVIEAIALARAALNEARSRATTDRALTLHIALLEAQLLTLVEGRTGEAIALCDRLESEYTRSSGLLTCRAAARLTALNASCTQAATLETALNELNDARRFAFDGEYEFNYWLARGYSVRAACAADDAARAEARRLMREAAAAYLAAVESNPDRFAIERSWVDETRALLNAGG